MKAIPTKELSLFDSTCVIVGIILGAGIYEITPTVASCMNGWKGILGIWLAGGLLALTGALCYAELATTYPKEGGDYVYQTRAYGKWDLIMKVWLYIYLASGDEANNGCSCPYKGKSQTGISRVVESQPEIHHQLS